MKKKEEEIVKMEKKLLIKQIECDKTELELK